MKKNTIKFFALAASTAFFASCSTWNHSYRLSEVPDRDLSVSDKYVVDINHDFSKIIKAESGKHGSPKSAMEEAYYKAITENNIHVLVDPIYSIKTTAKILIFGGKSKASVVGFAGYYANARPMSTELAKKQKAESELFDQKVKDLDKLSKVAALGSEEVKTFLIDTQGSACCGGDGKSKTESGGSNFGQMHLLHTTTNKPSLIDQYNKLNGNYSGSSDNNSSSAKSSASLDDGAKKKTIVQKVKSILSKIPIIGRLFR